MPRTYKSSIDSHHKKRKKYTDKILQEAVDVVLTTIKAKKSYWKILIYDHFKESTKVSKISTFKYAFFLNEIFFQ